MMWFKKSSPSSPVEAVAPVELAVDFDAGILGDKLRQLLDGMSEGGGLEPFVQALRNKHALFASTLADENLSALTPEAFMLLLETVFPARRKLADALRALPQERLQQLTRELVHGRGGVDARLQAFADALGGQGRKTRRAAWDLGAELLHFGDPEAYPLLCRWVWDARVQSGALREFIRANDSLPEIPLGQEAAQFEAARRWFAEQLTEHGFYRDIPYLLDLLLAQAYADYVLAMSNGMGMMGSDFGAKMEPIEWVLKLLGIEPERPGKSRIKRASVH